MAEEMKQFEVAPEGIPVAVRVSVPASWMQPPLPQEKTDFSNPVLMHPLALWMAPYGAVVFTVAARPGYSDGTLMDWMMYLAQAQEVKVTGMMPEKVGAPGKQRWGVYTKALQPSEAGNMVGRILLLEDGGNIITVMAMCPEPLWGSLGDMLETMVKTTEILNPSGPTVAIGKDFPADMGLSAAPEAPKPAAKAAPAKPPAKPAAKPAPKPSEDDEPALDFHAEMESLRAMAAGTEVPPELAESMSPPAEEPQQPSTTGPTVFAQFALAEDAESLNEEQKLNAFFRDNGHGLVPRVLNVDLAGKSATLGCGAIMGMVTVPLGWHVVDDGRRVLIFEPSNQTQINLSLRSREGQSDDQLMDALESDVAENSPGTKVARGDAEGTPFILFRDLNVDGETLQQVHFLAKHPRPEVYYHLRLTTTVEKMTPMGDLFGYIKDHTVFPQDS